MRGDHLIPRFRLARWASEDGKIAVMERPGPEVKLVDPEEFNRIIDFNTMKTPAGSKDRWLEQEFLAALDSDVARYLRQLEQVQPPRSHVRRVWKEDWHMGHLLAPRHSVRLAMYLGAEMTRHPGWRQAVKLDTAADMKRTVEERVRKDLAKATDPEEIERLEKLLGLRYFVAETPTNLLPHLSGHLAYHIGQALYERYSWAVYRFSEPVLVLGNDPIILINDKNRQVGSFSRMAQRENALSIYRAIPELVKKAVAVVQASNRIIMPIGPQHALVLTQIEYLCPPGRYDQPVALGQAFNRLTLASSRKWIAWHPGSELRVASEYPPASGASVAWEPSPEAASTRSA